MSCALDWCDVDLEGRRIYVHQSAHRVRASRDAETRTVYEVREIPTKCHRRHVFVPVEIIDYMKNFEQPRGFVLTGQADVPAETRTVQNRVKRMFDAYKIKNVNFQRLNKTYVKGQADPAILTEVFGD